MSVFAGPVALKKVYPLTPKGEYIYTLLDLLFEEAGTYGDSLLWKWLAAPLTDPTNYIARDDGNEKTFHEYTPPEVLVGSKAHEWIASLTGTVLGDGDEPPDSQDLIGKRMVAYLGHQAPRQGPNAGKLREKITQGTSRQWEGLPMKVARNVAPPSRPAPTQVSADPTDDEITRATLVTEIRRKVATLTKLDAELGTNAQSAVDQSDLSTAALDDLHGLLNDITKAITVAMDS